MKYADNRIAEELSAVRGYREANRLALKTGLRRFEVKALVGTVTTVPPIPE